MESFNGLTVNDIVKKIQKEIATEKEKNFIVNKIRNLVKSRCLKRFSEDEDLEDLQQRCFCKIWQSLKVYNDDRNFSTYAWIICESALNNEYLKRKRKKRGKQEYEIAMLTREFRLVSKEIEVKMVIESIFKRFPHEELLLSDIFNKVEGQDEYFVPRRINLLELAHKFNRPYSEIRTFIRRDLKKFVTKSLGVK